MKNLNLNREVNLNKKFILILVLVCILSMGFYSSYAYFQISVIKNNVVVIQTASINVTTEVVGNQNQTFTLGAGETKSVTVNLTSTANGEIAYKMYYELTSGSSTFDVTSTETFSNGVVEGVMNQSKTMTLTFKNTGSSGITLKLGTQGGLTGYPIILERGTSLVVRTGDLKDNIQTSIESSTCTSTVVENNITYLSGTNDCINFNYLWYSGKLWRITAIYPDGTMKMVTDDIITTIIYGGNVNFYTDASTSSYIYQWLNEDFLDTLVNRENIIITDSKWNVATASRINSKLGTTNMVTAPVGLLNSYEYYMSYKNTTNANDYLNIGYSWWLLNSSSTSNVWSVSNSGSASGNGPAANSLGVRPSVNLKSTIQLSGGSGTKGNPYQISGDGEKVEFGTTLLNSRVSGEYVNFNNELYRIVSVEDGKTKLNKNDYVKNENSEVTTDKFSYGVLFGDDSWSTGWDKNLNNTWYNSISSTYKNMLVSGTYYLGTTSTSYKGAICETISNTVTTKDCTKTATTWTGFVGLPRYGEMFASQQGSGYSSSNPMWLLNPSSSATVWYLETSGVASSYAPNSYTLGARPSIYLNSTVKITGGEGTKESPFELRLS